MRGTTGTFGSTQARGFYNGSALFYLSQNHKKNLREAYTNNVEQNGKESPADSANQKITYI